MTDSNSSIFFEDEALHQRPTKAQLRKAKRLLRTAKKTAKSGAPLVPKNEAQKEFLEALADNEQLVVTGPAGTGKTYLAVRYGVQLLLDGAVDKMIFTRPLVAVSNEKIGFLPGKLEQKMAPWMVPIFDAIKDSVTKEKLFELQQQEKIEVAPFQFIRGRTFPNSFIIADEAQNLTVEQFKALITRPGDGSRIVIDGDLAQSDLRGHNGLKFAVEMIEKHDIDAEIFEFTSDDIVRSGIVQQWVRAFELESLEEG